MAQFTQRNYDSSVSLNNTVIKLQENIYLFIYLFTGCFQLAEKTLLEHKFWEFCHMDDNYEHLKLKNENMNSDIKWSD